MGPTILEHGTIGPIVSEKEGSGPEVIGHKVDMIIGLRHRDFVPGSLGW